MTEQTPSRRAGLRDDIAAAIEAADYSGSMRRGDLADAVMPVLYREWPWLRAEADEAGLTDPEVRAQLHAVIKALGASETENKQLRARVRTLAARIRQGVPWTASDDDIAAHILAALDGPNNQRTTVNNPATSSDPHIYLSTGCYHGDHTYCQAMTGLNGAKRPGSCKFCHAACQCPCHQQTGPPVHIGGGANAEDCPACTGTNPPYPFTCPGPDKAAVDDLTGAWTPDPPIGCLTVTTEPDPFGCEERERTGRNAGLVLSAATEATDMGSELDDAAATIANHTVEINQLRHTLDEVLRHFVHKGHPGEPCLQTGWISERAVARWRAVLNPPKEQQS